MKLKITYFSQAANYLSKKATLPIHLLIIIKSLRLCGLLLVACTPMLGLTGLLFLLDLLNIMVGHKDSANNI